MSNPRSLFPLATAAVPLAVAAPALAVGAVIGLALIWLFSDDEKPATATAANGNEPTVPAEKTRSFGFFTDDDEPAAPSPAELAETQRRERLRANEAELATARRELAALESRRAQSNGSAPATLPAPRPAVRVVTAPSPTVTLPASSNGAASPTPNVTMTAATVPAASHVPAVTLRPPASDVATHARPVTNKAAAPLDASRKLVSFAPTVKREDLDAIFANGTKRLSRKEAVAALKGRGIKQTAAYNALSSGGRFSDCLEVCEGGLLAWKSGDRPSVSSTTSFAN